MSNTTQTMQGDTPPRLRRKSSVTDNKRMAKRYYSKTQFAAHLGMQPGELGSYERLESFPEPDVIVGEGPRATRGWSLETIERWNNGRRGSGKRIVVENKRAKKSTRTEK